jgi:hypothetical protein
MDVASQLMKLEKLLASDQNAAGHEVCSAIENLLGGAKKYERQVALLSKSIKPYPHVVINSPTCPLLLQRTTYP